MLAGLALAPALRAQTLAPLTLAVVPQHTALQTHRMWQPLIKQLQQDTGLQLRLKLYDKAAAFEQDLAAGVPDLVYLNPYQMVMLHKQHGYRALLRDDAQRLVGVLVVPADSAARTVADLNDKRLAFPSPNALGASLYMRALLEQKERIRFTPVYVGNHENVYLQVSSAEVAGGGVVERTLAQESESIRRQLRVIYRTPGVAPHPIAAHPRVSKDLSDQLSRALLALAATAEGRELLAAVALHKPVIADFERDYAPLERLGLERYVGSAKP